MVRTVVDRDLDVDHRIARDDAVIHSLAHAVLDRVDELLRNDAADDLVLECEAFTRLLRRELEPAMAILTMRIVSRYATCGLPTLQSTLNSRSMRSTMISK